MARSEDGRLPNARRAVVDREKMVSYLLNPVHPDNGGKAAFFEALGFTGFDWQGFADAMRRVAVVGSVTEEVESVHGTKYVVDGKIEGPGGRAAGVRTIWITDAGSETPRLVTAYPHRGDG